MPLEITLLKEHNAVSRISIDSLIYAKILSEYICIDPLTSTRRRGGQQGSFQIKNAFDVEKIQVQIICKNS